MLLFAFEFKSKRYALAKIVDGLPPVYGQAWQPADPTIVTGAHAYHSLIPSHCDI